MSYEKWMQQEIARLRAEANKANAEADALEQAHSRWTKANGREDETLEQPRPIKQTRRKQKRGYGGKTAAALERIAASPSGVSLDEMLDHMQQQFGEDEVIRH